MTTSPWIQRGSADEITDASGEQEVSNAWQEATPMAAKISSNPMNLRMKSGMAADSLNGRR